jgi:hypothetical protein
MEVYSWENMDFHEIEWDSNGNMSMILMDYEWGYRITIEILPSTRMKHTNRKSPN